MGHASEQTQALPPRAGLPNGKAGATAPSGSLRSRHSFSRRSFWEPTKLPEETAGQTRRAGPASPLTPVRQDFAVSCDRGRVKKNMVGNKKRDGVARQRGHTLYKARASCWGRGPARVGSWAATVLWSPLPGGRRQSRRAAVPGCPWSPGRGWARAGRTGRRGWRLARASPGLAGRSARKPSSGRGPPSLPRPCCTGRCRGCPSPPQRLPLQRQGRVQLALSGLGQPHPQDGREGQATWASQGWPVSAPSPPGKSPWEGDTGRRPPPAGT